MLKGLQGKNVVKVIGIEVIQSISLSLSLSLFLQPSAKLLLLTLDFHLLHFDTLCSMDDE